MQHIIILFNFFLGGENYFENNSNFLSDLLIAIMGALFSLGFTILFYRYQVRDDLNRNSNMQSKENEEKNEYFLYLVEKIIEEVKFTIETVEDFYNKLKLYPTELHFLKFQASNHLKRIFEINSMELMLSVLRNEKIKRSKNLFYSDLINKIDFIDARKKELYDLFIDYKKKQFLEIKSFLDLVNKIGDELKILISRNNDRYLNLMVIHNRYDELTSIKESDKLLMELTYYDEIHKNIIVEFKKIINFEYKEDENFREINKLINEAEKIFFYIVTASQDFSKNLEEGNIELIKTRSELIMLFHEMR